MKAHTETVFQKGVTDLLDAHLIIDINFFKD